MKSPLPNRHSERLMQMKTGIACLWFAWIGIVATAAIPDVHRQDAIPSTAERDKKPNIILIMADDLGYGSLGCYGSPRH